MTDSRLQVRKTPPVVNAVSPFRQSAPTCPDRETKRLGDVAVAARAPAELDAAGLCQPPFAANVGLAVAHEAPMQKAARPHRTSDVLSRILLDNPEAKAFSVERILASIGVDRFEASLLMFTLPSIVPIPKPLGLASLPAGAIAYQLASGATQIELPRFILKKTVSRRALAVAIHAILPVLRAAEKIVKPRWAWVNHASARRAVGIFAFLLAVAIAFPLFGFSPLHATSIFVMALGMAEQDGLAVLCGVVVGLLSLAAVAASGLSAKAMRAKVARWLRELSRKLGLRVFARYLHRRGYPRLARLLTFQWSTLLLAWDPEQRKARGHGATAQRTPLGLSRPSATPCRA